MIKLSDDGTMDTVLVCDNCGEEFRYNFQNADIDESDDPEADYDAFVEESIADASSEHDCETPSADAIWTNTGGNGRASAVYQRTENGRSAMCWVMPYRTCVDLFRGTTRVEEGFPFATLTEAKAYADRFISGDMEVI